MKILKIISVLLILSSFLTAQSYNYEEMEMEEYQALLQEWQGRVQAAQQGIADQDARITAANNCVDETQAQIESEWDAIYAALNSSKAEDFDQYRKDLQALRGDASSFLSMSPEEIYQRKDELEALQAKYAATAGNNLALLTENETVLNMIESMLMQAEEKGKPAEPDTYTVMRGDYLWRIAKKADIYGDAYAWMRIYTSNKDLIKDPDLIFPNQSFRIPRDVGPNEHLVAKGEFLSQIAGYSNVYGSPFKWQKLYEANKDVIVDQNLIYPYQVLAVPRN
jgi:nucleoid-associated protein YgaU